MGLASSMLNDIVGADVFDGAVEILTINPTEPSTKYGAVTEVWNICTSLQDSVITPVATMMMFVFFLIGIVDKLTSEHFTWEQVWRQLAMLLVSKYLIEHCMEVLEILYVIGLKFVDLLNVEYKALIEGAAEGETATVNYDEELKKFEKNLADGNFLMKLIAPLCVVVGLAVPWAATWVMKAIVYVICYTRMIELFVRALFAPIALADFFHSGFQGAGWRFLKSFLAVALQGVVILAISIIFANLTTLFVFSSEHLIPSIIKTLAFMFAGIALMMKSLSLTKELLGV